MEELTCIGCDAPLQTEDKEDIGFVPATVLEKGLESGNLYCQRCFRLRHYSEIAPTRHSDKDFLAILREIGRKDALFVNVVDIFDFNGSLIPDLASFTAGNDLLMVANKRDVLPHSLKVGRLKAWLAEQAAAAGLKPKEILVLSAKNQDDVRELMTKIEDHRRGRNVYVVGSANVGKSTLINAIIKNASGIDEKVNTTSRFPGTTLDKIEIPLAAANADGKQALLVDTPGLIAPGQLAQQLDAQDLNYLSPRKEIKPKTYQLEPGQTLFFGALARFDFIAGEAQGMTAYFDNELKIHRTKLAGADDFYERHRGELLSPELAGVKLVRKTFVVKEKSDLLFAGLGWICVPKQARVAAWLPEGADILLRKAMI
jgi:ribosome biogenesis GTPase YqeH